MCTLNILENVTSSSFDRADKVLSNVYFKYTRECHIKVALIELTGC